MIAMKPTQLKDAIRNIKKRFVAHMSITSIVCMGVTGLLSIYFMGSSFATFATHYYDEHNFKDLEVASSMGISEENLKQIAALEGVKDVEGAFSADGLLEKDGEVYSAILLSATHRISVPYATEGRMPEKPDECAICAPLMKKAGLAVGDEVVLSAVGPGNEDLLAHSTYTITGVCIHPDYLTANENKTVVLPEDSFDKSIVQGGYLRAYVDVDVAEGTEALRGDDYDRQVMVVEERIKELSDELGEARTKEVASTAEETYETAKKETEEKLAEGLSQLEAGEQELADNKEKANQELADALKKLEEAEKELAEKENEARTKLQAALKKLADGERELTDKEKEAKLKLEDALKKLEDGSKELAEKEKEAKAELLEAVKKLNSNEGTLAEKQKEAARALAKAWQTIQAGEKELKEKEDEADKELGAGLQKLLDGEDEYAAGLAKARKGEQEYAAGVKQLDEAEKKLAAGRKELDDAEKKYEQGLETLDGKLNEPIDKAEDVLKTLEGLLS